MKKLISFIFIFFLFFCLILILRSINLLGFPLYLDEGIYISWAKLISKDLSLAYVSLNDGKTPLFMWLLALGNHNINESLLVGRFISVIAGGVTAVSWGCITLITLGKRQLRAFMLLCLLVPYAFFVERLAFVDSLLTAFVSLSLLFLLLTREWINKCQGAILWLSLFLSILSGLTLALGYMTKTSASLFLMIQLLIGGIWMVELLLKVKLKKACLLLLNLGVMAAVYRELVSYMRVGAARFWGSIAQKELELTYTPKQAFQVLLHNPQLYLSHLWLTLQYFSTYLNFLIIILAIGAFLVLRKNALRGKATWILLYAGLTCVGIILAARTMSSRYLYPSIPAILVICSVGITWIWNQKKNISRWLLVFFLTTSATVSLRLVISPATFSYAGNEAQFTTGDVSTLGLSEILTMLKPTANQDIVAVNGIWGVSDGASISLQEAGIQSFGITNPLSQDRDDHWNLNLPELIQDKLPNKYLYVTSSDVNINALTSFPEVKLIRKFSRPGGKATYLFQLATANKIEF